MSKLLQTAALVLFWPFALLWGLSAIAAGMTFAFIAAIFNLWSE